MPKRVDWDKIREDFFETQDSYAAIALRHGVSKRSVEVRASEEGWKGVKRASSPQAMVEVLESDRIARHQQQREAVKEKAGSINEREIVNTSVFVLYQLIAGMVHDPVIDTRGIGSLTSSLVKLLEFNRKINPPTVAALVDLIIELNISPSELIAELKGREWSERQRA